MHHTTHLADGDGDDLVDRHRPRGYSITHGQVLGGFASLGVQTESSPVPPVPPMPVRHQPVRTTTKGSTDSSEAPATPIEWRDSFGAGPFDAPSPAQPTLSPKWAYLAARPCNPLEPLDVLSIEEMGLHSLDVGSLNDWEGCKLSAEILCPVNGHQRIEWSVAQTTRRNKKWVVVPNATVTCGVSEHLSPAEQAERSVIVTNRSLWLADAEAVAAPSPTKPTSASQRPSPSSLVGGTSHRSSMPFSGKAGFELCLLRPTCGTICPPVFLANASTHRAVRQHRRPSDPRGTQTLGRVAPGADAAADADADRLGVRVPSSVYPALRRSRSRPYLRKPPAQLRRSRSKPYLRASAQQPPAQPAATGSDPELFAPSLPGDPLLRTHPGESWPSARSRRSDSFSSFDSASASDAASDTSSSDEAALSTTNTRESMTGSMSSASYVQRGSKDDQRAYSRRSQAIPVAARDAHRNANRGPRSLSPGSSASRGMSSNSETSAAFAGWQFGSLEQQQQHQQQQQQQRARNQDNDSTSYEAESWLGTSPTTASASSMSASSKQSRGRKGFQRAMQKKDKMLSSWFKRRPENGSTPTSVSPVTDTEKTRANVAINSSVGMQPSMSTETADGNRRGSAKTVGLTSETTPLTETALETFQRAMFRPASPESTIMGSRRGSEALTQKTIEPAGNDGAGVQRPAQAYAQSAVARSAVDQAAEARVSGLESRQAVNSALSQVYGWDQQQAASKLLRPAANVTELARHWLQDLDEENALLGLEAVPGGALTMLIPLPLIGRSRAQDAVAYMRVNFVPFNSSAAAAAAAAAAAIGKELASGVNNASMQFGGSPGVESASTTLSASVSSGSSPFSERSGAAKSSEQSSWKRKLGLSSSRSANNAGAGAYQSQSAAAAAANSQAATEAGVAAHKSPQLGSNNNKIKDKDKNNKFEPFRVTAIVHDAPWTSRSSTEVDPRLPEPSAFPVVLGYCNDSKGFEMVPEGWASLRLAGPMPTKADGSPLDGRHPSHGVTDLIVAACVAVMDV